VANGIPSSSRERFRLTYGVGRSASATSNLIRSRAQSRGFTRHQMFLENDPESLACPRGSINVLSGYSGRI
jgi:hypothetical protein